MFLFVSSDDHSLDGHTDVCLRILHVLESQFGSRDESTHALDISHDSGRRGFQNLYIKYGAVVQILLQLVPDQKLVCLLEGEDDIAAGILAVNDKGRENITDVQILFDRKGRILAAFLQRDNALSVIVQVNGNFRLGNADDSDVQNVSFAEHLKGSLQILFKIFHRWCITHGYSFLSLIFGILLGIMC